MIMLNIRILVLTALMAGAGLAAGAPPAAAQPLGEALRGAEAREARFRQAARSAWAFVQRNYQSGTGMTRAHDEYPLVTIWDMGSMLAAYHSAFELGLIGEEEFTGRAGRLLRTLREMPLHDGVAWNKLYSATDGGMRGRDEQPSRRGYGWSVLDIGRLLVWLHVVAERHPALAADARAAVDRLDFSRLIAGGYLQGEDLHPGSGAPRRYPEGRVGYEQYAAEGFALWGHRAERALDFGAHTRPTEVFGVTVPADGRGADRLTSDPFILMGLELGWTSPEWENYARAVLDAQAARHRDTGIITMVNEDAVPVEPHYFYYYAVIHDGSPFVISAQGVDGTLQGPRWVSTKAAWGWDALLPDEYTRTAVAAVAPAHRNGWGLDAGVYEGTRDATGGANINTAAVVLQAAAFAVTGRPAVRAPQSP
jgi:hypothetical protein